MGGHSPAPPVPPHRRKPTGPRVHLAGRVVDTLYTALVSNVLMDPTYQGRERECYEVVAATRDYLNSYMAQGKVHDIVPGSGLTRTGYAFNRITLAERILMVFADTVVARVVRPGPTPEDRSSYELRDELAELNAELVQLVGEVIAVEDRIELKGSAA